jgi:hypothetical protein
MLLEGLAPTMTFVELVCDPSKTLLVGVDALYGTLYTSLHEQPGQICDRVLP